MIRYFILLLWAASAVTTLAQDNLQERIAPNSGEILKRGIELHDKKEYKKAVAEYQKIPANDTNYYSAQYEIALSLRSDSLTEDAIKVLEKIKDHPSSSQPEIYSLLGSYYDQTGQLEKSLETFRQGIGIAPAYYQLYFNMGVTLESAKRYQEAFEAYQKSVYYNPIHVSSNIRLGAMCYNAGMLPEAMMALIRAFLSEPAVGDKIVGFLEELSTEDVKPEYTLTVPHKVRDYEDIKLILVNKVALDKSYKLQSKIDYRIVRQIQALFEKINYEKNNPNFFNQQYARLYRDIYANKLFNGFVAYMFSGVSNEYLQKEIRKYQSDADKFRTWLINNLENSIAEQTLQEGSNKLTLYHVYTNKFTLLGKGPLAEGKKTGDWIYYHANGRVLARSQYKNDLNDGLWIFYNDNGNLKDSVNWKAGKRDGASVSYTYEGYLSQKLTYKADLLSGIVYNYYPSGILKNLITFKDDKRSGPVEAYFRAGMKEEEFSNIDDLVNGESKEYYANGSLYETVNFSKGKMEGLSKNYYINGNVRFERYYKAGQPTGTWKYYHANGQLSKTGQFQNGTSIGIWKIYNSEGKLIEEQNLDESGKLNGTVKYFSDEGKLTREENYVKGELLSYKCYDLNGKLLTEQKKSKGSLKIENYHPNGKISSTGLLTNNNREGEWKFYNSAGILTSTEMYKAGQLNGPTKNYHENGKLKKELQYKDDERAGLYKAYYSSGNIEEIGFYIQDKLNGFAKSYLESGPLDQRLYYLSGKLSGTAEYYYPDGRKSYIDTYLDGNLIQKEKLDSAGNSVSLYKLKGSSDTLRIKGLNGRVERESVMKGFSLEGLSRWYHGNGQVKVEGAYLDGDRNGTWKWFFPSGKLDTETEYLLGRAHGASTSYYESGAVEEKGENSMGERTGKWTAYFENGKVETERYYREGEAHGRFVYYTPLGDIARILYFRDGDLEAYAYIGKDGNEVAPVPVQNSGQFNIVTYYPNGQKAWDIPLVNGWWEGKCEAHYSNGKVFRTCYYTNDKRNGAYLTYYDNGTLESELSYRMGEPEGHWKYYDRQGNLLKEERYSNGLQHGESVYYKDKKPVKRVQYYYGEIVKEQ